MRARDNYDNHFVCEPRARETGQNEEEDERSAGGTMHTISNELKDGMKKKLMMMMIMTISQRRHRSRCLFIRTTVGDDDISVVVVAN